MTEPQRRHRLDALEPDNLLAFLALLGLLRALEASCPEWRPRAAWDLEQPPLRPILTIAEPANQQAICEATAEGVATLVAAIDFGSATDLKLAPSEARELLSRIAAERSDDAARYFAGLCAALISDAALARDQTGTAPTPLTYPKVARINFLGGLRTLSRAALPEQKNRTRDPKYPNSAADCIAQALFEPWERLDRPAGLRWDPDEAKRHAYQWNAPTDEQPKTQHGANRLAIVGLSCLTAAPSYSGSNVRLSVTGGEYDRSGFTLAWPIWSVPASFATIRALLSHPGLREPQALDHLSVDHVRVTRRISLDKYRNFTSAEPI
jgi:hypothetical protein